MKPLFAPGKLWPALALGLAFPLAGLAAAKPKEPVSLECSFSGGTSVYFILASSTSKSSCKRSDYNSECVVQRNGCNWDGSYAKSKEPPAPKATPENKSGSGIAEPKEKFKIDISKYKKMSSHKHAEPPEAPKIPEPEQASEQETTPEETAGEAEPPPLETAQIPHLYSQKSGGDVAKTGHKAAPPPKAASAALTDVELAQAELAQTTAHALAMKATMLTLKNNNLQNALLYQETNADLKSPDEMKDFFLSGISGSAGTGGGLSGLEESGVIRLDGSGVSRKKISASPKEDMESGISRRSKKAQELAEAGAAGAKGVAGVDSSSASRSGKGASTASNDPWVTYMAEKSKADLIEKLRQNPGLRDSILARIQELEAKGDNSGLIELLKESLAESQGEGGRSLAMADLLPMNAREAFSMNSDETNAEIAGLLSEFGVEWDPQFLPQETLFQRVTFAHRRSLVRGSIRQ